MEFGIIIHSIIMASFITLGIGIGLKVYEFRHKFAPGKINPLDELMGPYFQLKDVRELYMENSIDAFKLIDPMIRLGYRESDIFKQFTEWEIVRYNNKMPGETS